MPAFLWEGNDLGQDLKMTFQEVHDAVCQLVSAGGPGQRRGLEGNAELADGLNFGADMSAVAQCCNHMDADGRWRGLA